MYILYILILKIMEVSITEFRNNISTYFDKVYFGKEDIILKKRGYRLKLTYELDDEVIFDNAAKDKTVKNKLSLLASKL